MSKKSFIDSVEVKSPCAESWDAMTGSAKIRFCSHCSKHVNNISEMTRKEAMRLVRASNGNICIRYIADPTTKRPLFAGQFAQITRRAPGLAAGVMSASFALSTQAYAQDGSLPAEPKDNTVTVERLDKVKRDKNDSGALNNGRVVGTVLDPNGAVIAGTNVELKNESNGETRTTMSNAEGMYAFENVPNGKYTINYQSNGFRSKQVEAVEVAGNEVLQTATLEVGYVAMEGVMVVTNRVQYKNPLTIAVGRDDVGEVRNLIALGENVNGKEDDKTTPLFIAVENGNIEIVRLLLDYGARVNARDKDKQTPLMRLDDDATPDLVELLLNSGAKIDLTDNDGNTALIRAAASVKPEVLRRLIDAGADVSSRNSDGQTALMSAADSNQLENVRLLLMARADVNAKNKDGKSAWDFASDDDVQNLLVSFGAEVKQPVVDTPDERRLQK